MSERVQFRCARRRGAIAEAIRLHMAYSRDRGTRIGVARQIEGQDSGALDCWDSLGARFEWKGDGDGTVSVEILS